MKLKQKLIDNFGKYVNDPNFNFTAFNDNQYTKSDSIFCTQSFNIFKTAEQDSPELLIIVNLVFMSKCLMLSKQKEIPLVEAYKEFYQKESYKPDAIIKYLVKNIRNISKKNYVKQEDVEINDYLFPNIFKYRSKLNITNDLNYLLSVFEKEKNYAILTKNNLLSLLTSYKDLLKKQAELIPNDNYKVPMSFLQHNFKLLTEEYDLENDEDKIILDNYQTYIPLFLDFFQYVQNYKNDTEKVLPYTKEIVRQFDNGEVERKEEKFVLLKFKHVTSLINYDLNKWQHHSYVGLLTNFIMNSSKMITYKINNKKIIKSYNIFDPDKTQIIKGTGEFEISLRESFFDIISRNYKYFTKDFSRYYIETNDETIHKALTLLCNYEHDFINIQFFLDKIGWKPKDMRIDRIRNKLERILNKLVEAKFIASYLIQKNSIYLDKFQK